MSWNTSAPQRSTPAGMRVAAPPAAPGPPASGAGRRWSAPRGCAARRRRSPPSAPAILPNARRSDRASSSAWVGMLVPAVAGVDHAAAHLLRQERGGRRSRSGARPAGPASWRSASPPCRSGFRPLVMDEVRGLMLTTSAPSRLPASSKELWVRVEDSKNRFTRVRPRSRPSFFCFCRFRATKPSARSSRARASGGGSGRRRRSGDDRGTDRRWPRSCFRCPGRFPSKRRL